LISWYVARGRGVDFAMSGKSARRIADMLLQQNCDQRVFEVGLEEDQMEAVTKAFEELGCGVVREPFKPYLKVACPDQIRAQFLLARP
jgi:hypothetical protein